MPLMLTSSALYKQVLHTPHRRDSRLDVYDIDGTVLLQDVPIHSGQVDAVMTNRVTRTAEFVLSHDLYPGTDATAPLSPYQAVVRIRSGVRYGDGTRETFPIFTGRVYSATLSEAGQATFRADDLAADVIALPFEQPRPADQALILAQIRALISEAVPQAVFGTDTVTDAPTPVLVWDEDRGRALDDLAAALGGRWFTLGDGSFVVREMSYEPTTPVQEFLDGPGGLMSTATTDITLDGAVNAVTVVSERMDGTDPVRVTVRDTSTTSPTLYGGRFGRRGMVVKVQTPLSTAEAQTLARSYLAAGVALTQQWVSTVVADHTIEPGDCVRLAYRDQSAVQVLDRVSYPLGADEPMTLGSRSAVTVTDA